MNEATKKRLDEISEQMYYGRIDMAIANYKALSITESEFKEYLAEKRTELEEKINNGKTSDRHWSHLFGAVREFAMLGFYMRKK